MNYFDILFAKYKFEKDHPPIIKRTTGNPIVLTDAADAPLVECKTEIQGSQDLHGYDKPWVGGAGKNKLPMVLADIKARNTSGTWSGNNYTRNGVTFSVITDESENITGIKATGTATANTAIDLSVADVAKQVILNGCPSDGSEASYYIGISTLGYKCVGSDVYYNNYNNFLIYCFVASGYAIPSGGVLFTPMVRLSTESDSTFAPYSNICPITAYTENTIWVGGDNHYNEATTTEGIYISSTGEEVANNAAKSSDYITVTSNEFTLGYNASVGGTQNCRVHGYDKNKNWVQQIALIVSSTADRYYQTFSIPNEIAYIRFAIYKDFYAIMLNEGSTPLSYEPYNPNSTTHTTTYPSAIYRGSEDVVNGSVTANKLVEDVDPDNLIEVARGDDYCIVGYNISGIKRNTDSYSVTGIITNYLVEKSPNNQYNDKTSENSIAVASGSDRIQINIAGLVTLSSVKDFITAHPLQFAYELATPTTSSVTPTNLPIKSLSGYTNIESSTGDMDITYLTQNYQKFVDIIENNFENNLRTRKGGIKPLDVFRTLEVNKEPEEEEKKDEKVEDVKK